MRAQPLAFLGLALLLVPLLVPGVAPGAEAALPLKDPLPVAYQSVVRVSAPNGTAPDGAVHVTLTLSPASAAFKRLELFAPAAVEGQPRLLTLRAPSNLEIKDGKWVLPQLPDTLTLEYSFNPRVDKPGSGADLRITSEFALLKVDSLLPRIAYLQYNDEGLKDHALASITAGISFTGLPSGWIAASPYGPPGGHAFTVPTPAKGLPDITGFVVLGDLTHRTFEAHGIQVSLVRAPGATLWSGFEAFVRDSIPYYRAVYGDTVGRHVLAAGLPNTSMRRGGAALGASSFWSSDANPQTWAHEFTHLWQDWSATTGFVSDVWMKEGGAEYHSAMALRFTGTWTKTDVERFFERKRADMALDADMRGPLAQARYGSPTEDSAYRKGLLVIADLEETLAAAGHAEGLRPVYHAFVRGENGGDHALTLWKHLGGLGWPGDIRTRLHQALNLSGVPPEVPFTARARIVLTEPLAQPARPAAGEPVQVRVTAVNLGDLAGTLSGTLRWSGGPETAPLDATIPARGTRTYTLTVPAAPLGPHEVHAGDTVMPLLLPRPAMPTITNVTVTGPFLEGSQHRILVTAENRGDTVAVFSFSMQLDGRTILGAQPATLEPGASKTFEYPYTHVRGPHVLVVGDHAPVHYNVSAPADLRATSLEIPNSRVPVGEPFIVLVHVKNLGTLPGAREFTVRVDGVPAAQARAELDGGATTTLEMLVTVTSEGAYRISVDGMEDPLTVNARQSLIGGVPTPAPGSAALLAVAAAVALVTALRRPRR